MTTDSNLILFLGRLHPLLVHLPIGFLTLLVVIELADRIQRFKGSAQAREVVVLVTVLSAIASVLCGLMLSTGGGYDPTLLMWHKWMGVGLACGIFLCGYALWAKRPKAYNALLLINLLILAPASHFGGSMTHGKNYLTAYAPSWLRPASDSAVPVLAVKSKPPADASRARVFTEIVQPILQQNCIACHNADKNSGQLRLDTISFIKVGGKSGPAIVATNSNSSPLIQRILLPDADAHHMPPLGKPQPDEDQVQLLQWWIDSGASDQKSVAQLNPSADQLAMVSRFLKLPIPAQAGDAQPPEIAPLKLAEAQEQINALPASLGLVVTPFAADEPWIIVNASLNRSFGDESLQALLPLKSNIVDLNLSNTKITDVGLSTVGEFANLARLRLDHTAITDAGLSSLKKLGKLQYLNLYGTPVTDAGLPALASLSHLNHLYLWQTKVDASAATQFAATKTDGRKIAKLQKEIEAIKSQIAAQQVEVIGGVPSSTQPATKPTIRPMKK